MTISSTNRKAGPYSGNGVTAALPFSFKVFTAADVRVVRTDLTGVESDLTLTTHYTVALNADQDSNPGGTVNLVTAAATGYLTTLTSQVGNLQPVVLTNAGGFYPTVINTALDRLTIMVQQLAEKLGRALKYSISSPLGDSALPSPVANNVIGWNSTANGFQNYAPSDNTLLSAALAAPSGASLTGFLQAGAGAIPRTVQDELRDHYWNVKNAGAVGDGVADDTAALLAAAITASFGGKALYFPAGTYLSSGFPLHAGMRLVGESQLTTIIKLKSGTNAGLITSPTATIDDFTMENFRLDGNMANNTAGTVLEVKGWQPTLRNIVIVDAPGKGLHTDAGTVSAERQLGPCGHFNNILIDRTQEDGWIHNGGSDADFSDIVIMDAGLKKHNTYIGFAINSGGRFRNVHYWNRSMTTNAPAVGAYVGGYGGSNFTDSHFEGGVVPLSVASNGNTFESCAYYAPRGAYALSVTGTGNKVSGVMGIGAHHLFLSYTGLYLGGAGNTIDLVDIGCLNGSVQFGGAEANNKVNIGGYRASGPIIVGTPNVTDDVSANLTGPGGGYFNQVANAAWTAYTPVVTAGSGAITSYTVTGFYQKIGKKVDGRAFITLTNAGTAGFSIDFTLPVTAKSGIGLVMGREGTAGALLLGWLTTTSKASVQKADGSFVGSTGHQLLLNFSYEAA